MKRTISIFTLLFMAVILLASCGTAADQAANTSQLSSAVSSATGTVTDSETNSEVFPMTIKDSYDREVKIEKEPQRIVSLAPNITETVFALNGGKKLVGRTDYCDYPAETSQIKSVGTLKTPSIEKITELKPDLVIASTHFSKETLTKLEELKIPVIVLYGEESFNGAYDTIANVGKVINAREKAQNLIAEMKKKVDSVRAGVEGKDKPSVYYVVGYGKTGDYTAGKNTFIGQLLEMAGAKNAAADTEEWKYSLEKLIKANPDILICPSEGGFKQGLESTNGYKDLSAVKNGKIFEIDEDLINRQGPRLADGLVELAKIIHPEVSKQE